MLGHGKLMPAAGLSGTNGLFSIDIFGCCKPHQDSTYEMLDPSEFFIRPVDFVNLRQAGPTHVLVTCSRPWRGQSFHVRQMIASESFRRQSDSEVPQSSMQVQEKYTSELVHEAGLAFHSVRAQGG